MFIYYLPFRNRIDVLRDWIWLAHTDYRKAINCGLAGPSACLWMVPGTVNPED